ncbi:MAG: hypothetical protein PHD67_02025 [Oscillospiraceae bacterium]|nr:hypothetical protein [Oscillospiraceae bacterium]
MINELSKLAEAMEASGIQAQIWHRKYKPIPNIRAKAPCIRILIADGKVLGLSSVKEEMGSGLRKYGTNQGSYPCMNLAPLYRVTDGEVKKKISSLRPEDLDEEKIDEIRSWCTENNWGRKFQGKYKISMENTTAELASLVPDFQPIQMLIRESDFFMDPDALYQQLEDRAVEILQSKENVSLALNILFFYGNPEKKAVDDYGSLSVAFDTPELIDQGMPALGNKFTLEFNKALLSADPMETEGSDTGDVDAFGVAFEPLEEPMPEVKLAGGFDVKLRTMFKEQRCQTRYRRIENASYPISPQMRKKLQAALGWLSSAERKNVTWINTDKNEVLFAYPAALPEASISYTRMFKRPEKKDVAFGEQAKRFLTEIRQSKKADTDSRAEQIQLFILRKIDKGRTKVVYTRQTDPYELEKQSEAWQEGCFNRPLFAFGQPNVPFPLDAADILNRFWNQKGESITDKFRPIPKYHGMELLMDSQYPTAADLHCLAEKGMAIGAFLGKALAEGDRYHPIWDEVKDMLALTGLMLYRNGIGKDAYMESLPYLYGQLLKVSDELHALYCKAVRTDGALPAQLAGGTLYQAAVEAPIRTLSLLGQRMNPYITWAKTYRTKTVSEKGKESWKAGWLVSLYEKTADELVAAWDLQTRFNDEEKALLFLGYLASFPKKEQAVDGTEDINNTEEANDHE